MFVKTTKIDMVNFHGLGKPTLISGYLNGFFIVYGWYSNFRRPLPNYFYSSNATSGFYL
jgi:hypothetical protein